MRSLILTVAALALCVSALVACSPQDGSAPATASGSGTASSSGNNSTAQKATTTTPAAHQEDETRRISLEETQKAVAAGSAVIVDVRDEASYKTNHIKGAVSIPLQQFDKRMGELPQGKTIITYCA
ncbi:MAG TPA: rhodanese-like domain-containing protein [Pyrinomonadaceae bacterium]|nr:rhodanese-like domain-containing protein [Pyrinomonadaceae bacterium]